MKTGRPKKDITRNNRVEIRLTEEEMEELERCSAETGISKSEIMRNNLRMVCNLARHQSKKE